MTTHLLSACGNRCTHIYCWRLKRQNGRHLSSAGNHTTWCQSNVVSFVLAATVLPETFAPSHWKLPVEKNPAKCTTSPWAISQHRHPLQRKSQYRIWCFHDDQQAPTENTVSIRTQFVQMWEYAEHDLVENSLHDENFSQPGNISTNTVKHNKTMYVQCIKIAHCSKLYNTGFENSIS